MAEGVGFEPTEVLPSLVFKTSSFNRSDTLPGKMVRVEGLEPSRYCYQRIFGLLYVTIAALLRCSLDYVFTI